MSDGHLGGVPALTLDSDRCCLDLLSEEERQNDVPKLEGEALVVSEKIRVVSGLWRSMSMLRCCDILLSAIASGWAEVKGLYAVNLWFEWSWSESGKDGNPFSEVTLGRISASTPGEYWLMSAGGELRLNTGGEDVGDKRGARALLRSCNPKNKVSLPPEFTGLIIAGTEHVRSLSLVRCCAAIPDREAVLSGAAMVSVLTEVRDLNVVELWSKWSWNNSPKDGKNFLKAVILGRTSASTPGECWMMAV